MEVSQAYTKNLEAALEAKQASLDKKELVSLHDQFKIVQSAFQGLLNVLIKKGILHEDLYKYDSKLSEVTTPPEGSFTEAEKLDVTCQRLSAYLSQLDFLNNYYQFSVDFLDMARVKRLLAIAKYIAWTQFTTTSTSINTRALAEYVTVLRGGSDALTQGIVNDALLHLENATKAIFSDLKTLAFWHKESWKLMMRSRFMDEMEFEREFAVSHKEEAIKQVKRRFAQEMGEAPFYTELVVEILDETYAGDADTRRQAILKALEVKQEKKENKQEINFKATLMDGIRVIASVSYQISDCQSKLQENKLILSALDSGLWKKISTALKKMFNSQEKEVIYEIEYFDPITNTDKQEKLDFTSFSVEVDKKAKLLGSLNIKTSPSYNRIMTADEEHLFSFLQKTIEEMQIILRRLAGLDAYFRSEVPREARERLRGLKIEMTTIKNAIIKANQKKHEYVAQKEELEQMKRLGIRAEA